MEQQKVIRRENRFQRMLMAIPDTADELCSALLGCYGRCFAADLIASEIRRACAATNTLAYDDTKGSSGIGSRDLSNHKT